MKKGIHPELYRAIVRCGCGAEFETLSTKKELHVDVCIECHPLFGGKEKAEEKLTRSRKAKKG